MAAVVAFVAFAAAAVHFHQEPDTFVWLLVYGYAAILSGMAALRVNVLIAAAIGVAGYAAIAWKLVPTMTEALGLTLCALWCVALAAWHHLSAAR